MRSQQNHHLIETAAAQGEARAVDPREQYLSDLKLLIQDVRDKGDMLDEKASKYSIQNLEVDGKSRYSGEHEKWTLLEGRDTPETHQGEFTICPNKNLSLGCPRDLTWLLSSKRLWPYMLHEA